MTDDKRDQNFEGDHRHVDDTQRDPMGYDSRNNNEEYEKFNTERIYRDERYMQDKIDSYAHYSDYHHSPEDAEEQDHQEIIGEARGYSQESAEDYRSVYMDNLDSGDVRRIIKEEYETKYRPKSRWFSYFLASLFGAALGILLFAYVIPGFTSQESPIKEISTNGIQSIQINTSEDMSIEAAVNAKASNSVVGITTMSEMTNQFFMQKYMTEGVGSGVIVSSDGYILTNSHVVNDGRAKEINVVFADKQMEPATLMWYEPELDLAVIKVEKSGLIPIEIGNSDEIMVGDKAIAIGNPLGLDLQSTLTSGYISGLDRTITVSTGNTMDGLIQTDAAINSGNSGGALLNSKGQLIGINTAKAQGGEGIGFAIPINVAQAIVHRIETSGNFEPVLLGIKGVNLDYYVSMTGTKFETKEGIIVLEVIGGGPAEEAGVQNMDVITAINGEPIESMGKLKQVLLGYNVGDSVTVRVLRDQLEEELNLTFSSNVQ